MANSQGQRKRPPQQGLRNNDSGDTSSGMFNLRKGVRDFAILVIVLNVLNVIFYNTGWINFKADTFDTIWATSVCVLDLAIIAMFSLLDK